MGSSLVGAGLLMALLVAASVSAQDGDLAEGKKLYDKQCAVCHGNVAQPATGDLAPVRSQRRFVHAEIPQSTGATMADVPMTPRWREGTATGILPGEDVYTPERVAVVPLYGPQLRGVLGRSAGTVKGYQYSETFLKKMNGVAWDEASMNKWITSSQAMVPGTYMFYSQKDPEIRRKIIEYLKANP
ncbi:MAG TPA: c-type cytochrome [Burkholderiales bacterium]|jgi:cytochrome c2|nr:c-type cytochrome [Burkholderiales bacterium]